MLLVPEFPAAAANKISAALAFEIASRRASELPPPPQLLFRTRILASVGNCAFSCVAKLIARIASEV